MKTIFCILFSSFIFLQNASAQTAGLDSLASAVGQLPEDTTKIRQLYDLAKKYDKENWDDGLKFFQKTYALAKQLDAREWLPKLEYAIARGHANIGRLDSALVYLEPASKGFDEQGNWKKLASCYKVFLFIYKRLGEYEKATEYAFKTLEINEEHKYTKGIALAYGKIGSLFYWLEKWDDALAYTQKSYDLAKRENLLSELAYAAQLLADLWAELGEYEKALAFQSEGLALSRQLGRKYSISNSLNSRGNILMSLKRYPEALADFEEYLKMSRNLGADRMENIALQNIGIANNLLGNYQKALPYHLNALSYIKATDLHYLESVCYEQLAASYAGMGRFDSAFFYQKLNMEISDSLLNAENTERVSELQTKYETAQKEAKITLQQGQLARQRSRLLAIVAFLAIALLAGALLFRLTRQLRKRNEEKEFLIKEIHHRVKNNLQVLSSLLHLQSRHIKDENALDAVREGQTRVEAMSLIHQKLYMGDKLAAVEMQDYLHNLGDTLLDTFGLDDGRIKIIYEVQPMHLDVDTAIPLGLIINELVTNSLKYAFPNGRKGSIEIALWKNKPGRLCLKIADDGVGKDAAPELKNSTSFGTNLVNILSKKLKGTPVVSDGEGYATLIEFGQL
ncbi:MAG TPA: hypothetical protein ENJ95_15060 [Bacteroidetes bacterium]|nr:hypothetical protein [Bacteroidota bacterium]